MVEGLLPPPRHSQHLAALARGLVVGGVLAQGLHRNAVGLGVDNAPSLRIGPAENGGLVVHKGLDGGLNLIGHSVLLFSVFKGLSAPFDGLSITHF